jgi:hypothetical protein
MTNTHIAVAQEVDRYAADRIVAAAAAKATRMWPGVIGEVLAEEIMTTLDLPAWLRTQRRTQRLIEAILSLEEQDDERQRSGKWCADVPLSALVRLN